MSVLDCGHESTLPAKYVCVHICEYFFKIREGEYKKVFTGVGRTYHLACERCVDKSEKEPISWRSVCDQCFAEIESEGDHVGFHGYPEVLEELSSLGFSHRVVKGLGSDLGTLLLVQPMAQSQSGDWVGLTTSGALILFNMDSGKYQHLTNLSPEEMDITQPVSLLCSPNGEFLCLTQTLGNVGVVIERSSGRRALHLKRDGYKSYVSPFPVAFIVQEGRTLLIHSTGWNHLDITDPTTGELLTGRSLTPCEDKTQRPHHFLDYFHGRLAVSPNYEFIADDGWVWHPVGRVCTWSVHRWLNENVWESEDGPTRKVLLDRAYFWGGPMCWVNDHTLAVWGAGGDDLWLLPAICLFDVVSGEQRDWFPCPELTSKKHAKMTKDSESSLVNFGGWLTFDDYLFVADEKSGVSIWNHINGARLYQDISFVPIAYHPATKEFLTILPDGDFKLSRLVQKESYA